MSEISKVQEQHTAGFQAIGFDYQFYYFMCLALELKHGQKVGFEVKDDVHIDNEDGTTVLFQAKHTVLKNADGSSDNLTTLDSDLWKTLSNWAEMIKSDSFNLFTHSFRLVTNKSDGNNTFIDALILFKKDNDVDKVIETLTVLQAKTKDNELKKYFKNILSISKTKSKIFYSRLSFETNIDDIIGKVKSKILESVRNQDLIEPVFESLSANLHQAKYIDIKDRKKFEITFSEFNERFGKCFRVAFEKKPLPKREFPIQLPENLEEQIFIKQLLDIGELENNSIDITDYTAQMLQVMNNLSYWMENNFILPTEMNDFNENAIIKWKNEFNSKYRQIKAKILFGNQIENLESDIKGLGLELIDFIKRENLSIAENTLGIAFSNGHYYALSNKPEIGWHFDWERKYKEV